MLKVARSVPICKAALIYTRRSGGTAHEGGGATSQLDLPSLHATLLSIAGCVQLQLGVPHYAASATSVDYC